MLRPLDSAAGVPEPVGGGALSGVPKPLTQQQHPALYRKEQLHIPHVNVGGILLLLKAFEVPGPDPAPLALSS